MKPDAESLLQSQEADLRRLYLVGVRLPDLVSRWLKINPAYEPPRMPKIVCLCGSTRFIKEFSEANLRETLAGNIVLSIGADTKSDDEHFGHLTVQEFNQVKSRLDELHKRKIDLADEVLILNKNGYIGESTLSELNYAMGQLKVIRYLEHPTHA